MHHRIVLTALCLLLTTANLPAQPPQKFSYQGLLTTPGGGAIPDGPYDLTFSLYTADTGGIPIWTETHTGVPVSKGTFGAILGSITPLVGVNFGQQLYLGLAVGSDPEFSPRSSLTSAPASLAPWAINGSDISFANGKVGVGLSNPAYPLQVNGAIGMNGALYQGGGKYVHSPDVNSFYAGYFAGFQDLGAGSGGNTGVGYSALTSTVSGYQNTAIGAGTLVFNDGGYANTAAGFEALRDNVGGISNTASGAYSLTTNNSGSYNSAVGTYSLQANSSGVSNTAVGYSALSLNGGNSANTAVGFKALEGTSASDYNTAVGANAGSLYDNGYNNVFVGANVDVTGSGMFNVIAIGQGTLVSGSSTARFGNPATGSYGGWAGWSNVSDGRFKKNVRENVPGLAFIVKLRPVTYNLDASGMEAYLQNNVTADLKESDGSRPASAATELYRQALLEKEMVVYTGFVAQEVEASARDLGFEFSGVDGPKDGDDYYSLRYAEFVVPLVKAVQEQQQMIEELRGMIRELLADPARGSRPAGAPKQ